MHHKAFGGRAPQNLMQGELTTGFRGDGASQRGKEREGRERKRHLFLNRSPPLYVFNHALDC